MRSDHLKTMIGIIGLLFAVLAFPVGATAKLKGSSQKVLEEAYRVNDNFWSPSDAKKSKRAKKSSKRTCMVSCRKTHKTQACVGARKKIVGSLFKAIGALATDDSCRGYLKEAHDALKKANAAEDKESPEKEK